MVYWLHPRRLSLCPSERISRLVSLQSGRLRLRLCLRRRSVDLFCKKLLINSSLGSRISLLLQQQKGTKEKGNLDELENCDSVALLSTSPMELSEESQELEDVVGDSPSVFCQTGTLLLCQSPPLPFFSPLPLLTPTLDKMRWKFEQGGMGGDAASKLSPAYNSPRN